MSDELLLNVAQIAPLEQLKKMKYLKELAPYLPASVAGLQVRIDDSERGMTRLARQGAFTTVSNTPAMQLMTRAYDPRDIVKFMEEEVIRDYDSDLLAWEGDWDKVLKPRGGRNPFYLLEMALEMGPTGDHFKRGPTPYNWEVLAKATTKVIAKLKAALGGVVQPKQFVPVTPQSANVGLRIAHVMNNSAGEPYFSDKDSGKTSKLNHLEEALRAAYRFSQPGETSLPLYPFDAFARGDRAAPWAVYMDTPAALELAVTDKKDRLIAAQSFDLQLMDGVVVQALTEAISVSAYPQYDIREPTRLSTHFEDGHETMQRLGDTAFSIGRDESAWDLHFAPQLWYAVFKVVKALLPDQLEMLFVFADRPLLLEAWELEKYKDLAPGEQTTGTFRYLELEEEKSKEFEVAKLLIDSDTYLRRVIAGASGTGAAFGNILVDGYQTVLDTPEDGKFLTGFGQRSGNFGTFLYNCIGNDIKTEYIDIGSKDATVLAEFKSFHGYEPPAMELAWLVIRGDDAGDIWVIEDRPSPDWSISKLITDWLLLTGAKANADKQEATDIRGLWQISFAQVFSNDRFPRGMSSVVRVLERNVWNEADEVVTVDPDSGADLRPYLEMMNTYGRVNNLWGLWDREVHPVAKSFTKALQKLDRKNRLLPPLDDESRQQAGMAYALKLVRRGQLAPEQIGDVIRSFWTTDLAQYALELYDKNEELHNREWAPIRSFGDDARPEWRSGS